MPANVESAVFANEAAWHREGTVLDTDGAKGITVPKALKTSGLDWTVEKVPVFAPAPGWSGPEGTAPDKLVAVEDRFGVQRSSDGKVLGVVGETWQPVQNTEGFEVIEDFLQGTDAWIEAAGALNGGRKVWILAHMAKDLFIAGEQISQFVLFANGHDGRTAVNAAMTDVRVVCQNTLALALGSTQRKVSIRHTAKATERLAEAKRILGLRDVYAEELAKQGEWLVNQKMSDKAFDVFLESLMPIDEEQEDKPAGTMIRDRREAIRDTYQGDNLNNIRGTRWGALNAVIEYSDHKRKFRDGETQLKAQFGVTDTTLKQQAYSMLTPA